MSLSIDSMNHIRHINYEFSKVGSSVVSSTVPRPAGVYAAWNLICICLALLLTWGPHGFIACRGSVGAHFASGAAGFSRLEQQRHGRLLVSSSGMANVSNGSLFVAALRDPAVKRILLTAPLVNVPLDTWEAVGGNLPILITRNLTLEGNEFDWPLLRLNYVKDVIRLMDTVTLVIRFVFLDGANGDNNYREQGFSFLAPMPPNQTSEMHFGPGAMSLRFCFPTDLQLQAGRSIEKPTRYQDSKQLILLNYLPHQQGGCRNGSYVPPLQRCWVDGALIVEMAGDGNRVDPSSDQSVLTNILFLLRNVTGLCENLVSATCLKKPQAEAHVCFMETKRMFENVTTSFLDDYQPGPPLQILDGSGSSSPVNQAQLQDSPPPAASGAEENRAHSRAVVVGAVVAGTVVVVCIVAVMVVAPVLSKRQQEYCKGVGGSRATTPFKMLWTSSFGRTRLGSGSCPGPAAQQLVSTGTSDETGSSGSRGHSVMSYDRGGLSQSVPAEVAVAVGPRLEQAGCVEPTVATSLTQAAEIITPDTRPQSNLELHVQLMDPPAGAAAGVGAGSSNNNYLSNNSSCHTEAAAEDAMPLHPKDDDEGSGNRSDPCCNPRSSVVELSSVVRGKGSFGRVVEGTYQGQRVAVKVLASDGPWGCPNEAFDISFAHEIQVLSRCCHPNVVRLLAACVESPRLCLVLELMETSLEHLLYADPVAPPMPLPKVLHIAISITNALAYLHPTISHRDLKPANVLLNQPHSDRPTVKLTDFGLSRLRVTVVPTEHPDAGTPAYMAPECFDLQNSQVTHKADMFSLAVLLWEMLACQRPWPGLNPLAIGLMVAFNGMRLPLNDLLASERCPPKLCRLLRACWEADPDRRPAAAEAVKELALILQLQQQQPEQNQQQQQSQLQPSLAKPPLQQLQQLLQQEGRLVQSVQRRVGQEGGGRGRLQQVALDVAIVPLECTTQQAIAQLWLPDISEEDLREDLQCSYSSLAAEGAARGAARTVP